MIKKILWVSIILVIIGVLGMIVQKANAFKMDQTKETVSEAPDSGKFGLKTQP